MYNVLTADYTECFMNSRISLYNICIIVKSVVSSGLDLCSVMPPPESLSLQYYILLYKDFGRDEFLPR